MNAGTQGHRALATQRPDGNSRSIARTTSFLPTVVQARSLGRIIRPLDPLQMCLVAALRLNHCTPTWRELGEQRCSARASIHCTRRTGAGERNRATQLETSSILVDHRPPDMAL